MEKLKLLSIRFDFGEYRIFFVLAQKEPDEQFIPYCVTITNAENIALESFFTYRLANKTQAAMFIKRFVEKFKDELTDDIKKNEEGFNR